MNITNHANLSVIEKTFAAIGATVPKPVAQALELRQKVLPAARGITADQSVGDAVTAALLAGEDPAGDAAVQRAVTARVLMAENIGTQVEQEVEARTVRAYTANVDAIVAVWSAPFADAAATLTDAHNMLGDVALDDAHAILPKGAAAATAWGQARAADATIDTIMSGWFALVTITRTASLDRRHIVLRKAAVTFDQWVDQQLAESNLTAWDAVRRGLALSLPTPAEYHARIRALEAGRVQAEHDLTERTKDYNGRRPRVGR